MAYKSDINELIEFLSNFGFGKNICVDCFLPDKGLLPNPKWKMNNLNFGWVKGDTVNLGVGQGYMSATPIQLAYYAALIANKGILNEFSFVQDSEETAKNNLISTNINDNDWEKINS